MLPSILYLRGKQRFDLDTIYFHKDEFSNDFLVSYRESSFVLDMKQTNLVPSNSFHQQSFDVIVNYCQECFEIN